MVDIDWLSVAGLVLSLSGVVAYLILLFVIHDFTYRTWLFDGVVGLGVGLAVLGWLNGGSGLLTFIGAAVGAAWFLITRRELAIHGSDRLKLRAGDRLPLFELMTTHHEVFATDDLVADAPALFVLYRGWWCPSHKPQLDEMVAAYGRLAERGVSIYAASVDGPDESQPIQERVGDKLTILCGVSESLLDEIGVKDKRGAPWYDRLIFGAKEQVIAMPAVILIDRNGLVVHASRSSRLDVRPAEMMATLNSLV